MTRPYLDLVEAATEFSRRGFPVKASTIRRWQATGKIQSMRAGKILRIPRSAIDEFFAKNTKYQDDDYSNIRGKRRV